MTRDEATSLEFLKAVYCNNDLPLATRMRAAIAALPFENPKLAVSALVNEQDFATMLDRRIAKLKEAEANHQQVDVKPALPRIGLNKRYRRI
jgi:hypothetical protein